MKKCQISLRITMLAVLISMAAAPAVFADTDRHKIIDSGTYTNSSCTEYTLSATGQEYYTHVDLADEDGRVNDISGENAINVEGAYVIYYFEVPADMYDNRLIEQFRIKIGYDNVTYANVDGEIDNGPPEFDCFNEGLKVYYEWDEMQKTGQGSYRTIEKNTLDVYPSENYYIEPYTKLIKIKIFAPDGDGTAPGDVDAKIDIDEVSVIFNLQKLEITTTETPFNFGNVYVNTNASIRVYNESRKKSFQFKNIGTAGYGLNWTISSDQSWIRLSKTSGWLMGQNNDMVEVWLQPSGAPGTYTGTITFRSGSQDVDIPVLAKAYHPQISYVGPQKGLNNRVNVILNGTVSFQVATEGTANPNAQFGGYLWKKVSGSLGSSTLDSLTINDFELTSTSTKNYTSLSPAGTYTVYCETYETVGSCQVESDPLTIPVRICNDPILHIDYPNSTRVTATQTTTDNTLHLCLKGYDGEIGNVPGTWTLIGGIGTLSRVYGTSTYLDLTTPGAGTVTVTDGVYTTTTGLITVGLGKLDNFRIEYPEGTEVTAPVITTDNFMHLYAKGYDADNNWITNIAGTWTTEGSLEDCKLAYGTSTIFDPTRTGTGTIRVTAGSFTDTTDLTVVNPGALQHIRIEYFDGTGAGATQTTTDDFLSLYLRGYDTENNRIGDIVGTWTVKEGIGNCTPRCGTSTIFNPTTPKIGSITVTNGIQTDTTGMITVSVGVLNHVRIEYFVGSETGAIQSTTDNTHTLYLRGYDADNNLIGDVAGTWTVGQEIGNCAPRNGSSTVFNWTKPGTVTITVTNGSHTDTTDSITISLGVLDHIHIEYPDGTEVCATQTTTDAILTICLRGYDADNNLIGDIAGTWTVEGGLENCTPGHGNSTIFDWARPSTGTITATNGIHSDTTSLITVGLGAIDHICIEYPDGTEVGATHTTTDGTLTLYLRGYDADNNLIGDIVGTWTVEGWVGICIRGDGTEIIFDPTKPGTSRITVTDGVHTDTTGEITVSLGALYRIHIEDDNGNEIGGIHTTTDNIHNMYLRGYDADHNLIGDVIGKWTVEPEIGICTPDYGSSTIFNCARPEASTITATDGIHSDTTGLFTVSLGVLDHIRIEYPDGTDAAATRTITDNSFTLCLRGYDAANNLIGAMAGTWTVAGGIGSFTPGYGTTTVFDPTRVGSDTISVQLGTLTDTVTATISHGLPATFALISATCTLTADGSQTYIVRATDSDKNYWDEANIIWSTDDPAGMMSDNSYYPGRVGTWTITGTTSSGRVATTTVNVTPGAFVNLNLTAPATTTTLATFTLTVSLHDSDNNPYSGAIALTNTTKSI
ncbi:MAG: hypothetical protein ABH886_03540, partial [Candidatus Desantisbacteria bacterium]